MEKKIKVFIIVLTIFCSSVSVIFLVGTESKNFLAQKQVQHQFDEYIQRYYWSDNSLIELQDILHSTCKDLLTDEKISLERRYIIASFMSNLMTTDMPILYLISSELAKMLSGEFRPYHHGVQ